MSDAKTMNRSRNQLANAYAPQSFFTFEGGRGACIAHSSVGEALTLPDTTQEQIFERLNEMTRTWFDIAMTARAADASKPPVMPAQCVDRHLLDAAKQTFEPLSQDQVHFCKPTSMGYSPAPLAFACRTCGIFRDFPNLADLDAALDTMTPEHCPNPRKQGDCNWEQLDVIFVHWSGRWVQPFPGQYHWNSREGKVRAIRDKCTCGSDLFTLNRRSAAIGEWFFQCAKCTKPLSSTRWLQNDPDTLSIIGPQMTPARLTEVHMEATPYRASNAYYVMSDLLIDYKDGGHDLLSRLQPGREEELKALIADRFGFGVREPTDDEIASVSRNRLDCANEWTEFQQLLATLKTANEMLETAADPLRALLKASRDTALSAKRRIIADLQRRSILVPVTELPAELVAKLENRHRQFAPRFDPFRLAVEHAALQETRLAVERQIGGKRPFVSFTRLDQDLSPSSEGELERLQAITRRCMRLMGLAEMGLVREFDLCRFSFGYSRMESGPILRDKRHMNMPVRLNLFPRVQTGDGWKNPIYVVQQANQAIYVRLDPQRVHQWLLAQNCADAFDLTDGKHIGACLLEAAPSMKAFLDGLPQSDHPSVYYYTYTLLHSYSHLLMKYISEYSGLDLGSLGEYIFPADLAFVVYRNGTTMDLGNMSAMWRNVGPAILIGMLQPRAAQCGTGSLCTHRGGACPDCLMAPETSCIASNKLLSRSVLRRTGGRPRFDTRDDFQTVGYFDTVADNINEEDQRPVDPPVRTAGQD